MGKSDPMSPIISNVIADRFTILIARAKKDSRLGGLIPHLVDRGVSILQYADGTVILMERDLQNIISMKLILCPLEQLLGFKIKFQKSELFCFGKVKEEESIFGQLSRFILIFTKVGSSVLVSSRQRVSTRNCFAVWDVKGLTLPKQKSSL